MTATSVAPATRRSTRTSPGIGAALLSAAAFGLSGSLAKSLLEIGWTPGAVVVARVGGAFLALLLPCFLLLRRTGRPTARQSRRLVAYGVFAVAAAQICYFSAVQYLSVGVALLLEYLAPVLLLGWHWWRTKVPPTGRMIGGAVLAMAGMVLVLDVLHGLRLNPVGVLWGLGAAVCLCGYFLLSEDEDDRPVAPLLVTTVGTGIGAAMVLGAAALGFLPLRFAAERTRLAGADVPWVVPVLLLIGIAAVLAYLTGIAAVRRLGSSLASFVSLSEVLFAVVFAVALLGQHPSAVQLVGGLLVLTGIAVVQRGPRGAAPASPALDPDGG